VWLVRVTITEAGAAGELFNRTSTGISDHKPHHAAALIV
jgi:hypothetical protein